MRFNPKARVDSGSVQSGGGGGFGGGGGGMRLPIPTGGGSLKMTIVIIIIYVLIQMCSGAKLPGPDLGAGQETPSQQPKGGTSSCATGEDANKDPYNCGIEFFAASAQDFWAKEFPKQVNGQYQPAGIVRFQGQTQSGCGAASSAMGPFYCPNDHKVYVDVNFMEEMLEGQLGGKGGDFALGYVVAHEYGHHVENVLGYLRKARQGSGPDSDGVKIELMADCLAGMWAKAATTTTDEHGEAIILDLTSEDINEALDAAQRVGDDYIQKKSGGQVNEGAWTHGSSEQRQKWFNIGLNEGSIRACDTFAAGSL